MRHASLSLSLSLSVVFHLASRMCQCGDDGITVVLISLTRTVWLSAVFLVHGSTCMCIVGYMRESGRKQMIVETLDHSEDLDFPTQGTARRTDLWPTRGGESGTKCRYEDKGESRGNTLLIPANQNIRRPRSKFV